MTRAVPELLYEAYRAMAEAELQRLAEEAIDRHTLCAAAVAHRIGPVPLSEPSVLVASSAPHRPEAFAGARQLIDDIKVRAPIWKCEDGAWKHEAVPPVPGR